MKRRQKHRCLLTWRWAEAGRNAARKCQLSSLARCYSLWILWGSSRSRVWPFRLWEKLSRDLHPIGISTSRRSTSGILFLSARTCRHTSVYPYYFNFIHAYRSTYTFFFSRHLSVIQYSYGKTREYVGRRMSRILIRFHWSAKKVYKSIVM